MPSKVPPNWKVVRLEDVAEVRKGTSFTSKSLVPGNVPVIAGGKQPAYYHNTANRKGRIVTVSASGAAGFVAYHSDPIFATDCITIQSSSEHSDTRYIYHYLKHRQEDIYRLKNGSAQPHIYPRDLVNLNIVLPPIDEQLLIAQILDSVDKACRKTEELRRKTEQLRVAIIHKLLTRGLPGHHAEWKKATRLGTYPASWKACLLRDVATINPRRPKLEVSLDKEISFIPMADVGENCYGLMNQQVRSYEVVSKGYTYFEENDILFAKITPCLQNGKHLIASGLTDGFGFGTTEFHVVRVKAKVDARFLFYILTQKKYIDECANSFTGTAGQQRIQPDVLKSLPLAIPTLNEQREIVSHILVIDNLLQTLFAENDQLNLFKQALSNVMFDRPIRF